MQLGIERLSNKKIADRTTTFPEGKLEGKNLITRKGTISDITKLVESLGLDTTSDIIFNGTDSVAVQKISPNYPPYYSPTSKVVLKVTRDADCGRHPLLVSGYSNDKQSQRKVVTIELNVEVKETN